MWFPSKKSHSKRAIISHFWNLLNIYRIVLNLVQYCHTTSFYQAETTLSALEKLCYCQKYTTVSEKFPLMYKAIIPKEIEPMYFIHIMFWLVLRSWSSLQRTETLEKMPSWPLVLWLETKSRSSTWSVTSRSSVAPWGLRNVWTMSDTVSRSSTSHWRYVVPKVPFNHTVYWKWCN